MNCICIVPVSVCMRVLCENMYVQYVRVLRYKYMYVCMYVCMYAMSYCLSLDRIEKDVTTSSLCQVHSGRCIGAGRVL